MQILVQACTRRSHTHAVNQDRATVGTDVLSATVDVQHRCLQPPALVAVLDGVGGAPAGDVASDLAAHTVSAPDPPGDEQDTTRLLERADQVLLDAARVDPTRSGMATTAAMLVLPDESGRVLVGNVGDSVVSRLDGDSLHDVSVSDRGRGHVILQSLGGLASAVTTPHVDTLQLAVGDRLLLATDGLTDVVAADVVEDVLRREGDGAAARLLRMVEAAGAPDDVTIVIVDARLDEDEEPARRRQGGRGTRQRARTISAQDARPPRSGPSPPATGLEGW